MKARLPPIIAIAIVAFGFPPARAAPSGLLNKSVEVRWNHSFSSTRATGGSAAFRRFSSRTVYISSAGRPFVRTNLVSAPRNDGKSNGFGGTFYSGPDQKGSESARIVRDHIVGTVTYATGAMQYTVSFNSNFTSCSVNVIMGRANGRFVLGDREPLEVQSASVSGESCQIREGNALSQ